MLHFHRCRPGRREPSLKSQAKVGAPGREPPLSETQACLVNVERPDASRPPLHAEAKTRPPGDPSSSQEGAVKPGGKRGDHYPSRGATRLGPSVALQETPGRAPVVLAGSKPSLFPVHPFSDLSRAIIEARRMGCQREHAAISCKVRSAAARIREMEALS